MKPNPAELFRDTTLITQAVHLALRDARILHKKMGVPMAVYQNGKTIMIAPEDIIVDPPTPSH